MEIYEKKYIKNLARNLHKRESFQNIFVIGNVFQNYKDKFNFNLSNNSSLIEPYTIKNINIYKINNNLNNNYLNMNIHNLNSNNNNKIHLFRRKKIHISYFEKIKNLYFSKTPKYLSERVLSDNKKLSFNQNNINISHNISRNSYNYSLPKIANSRKGIIDNNVNKNNNIISLENQCINNKNEYHLNKMKLPRIKSTILYKGKNACNNRNINRNYKKIRCNSSLNVSKIAAKSIYMSLGLTPKKENNLNLNNFNKIILLKNYKRKSNNGQNENNKNNNNINIVNINDLSDIKKDNNNIKKSLNKVMINNIMNEDSKLLNDKGTLISFSN